MREQRQGPRIDQYFLRGNRSNQSNEAQQRDTNQSSQSISTPVTGEKVTSTEIVVEEPVQLQSEKKIEGRKPGVKWPKAVNKKEWETINSDLTQILEQQVGTVAEMLERMGGIIYNYGEEHFRVEKGRGGKKLPTQTKSRRQQEIERLVKERRHEKQWKRASDVEREGLMPLQVDIKNWLATSRRAENLRKRCRNKEHVITRFYKDPFSFAKDDFAKEKSGTLKTSRQELEKHLENVHHDMKRHEQIVIPPDMPAYSTWTLALQNGKR